MAVSAAIIGGATALWLPATVAAGAGAAAFVGYKIARSLVGGTFGYFLSKTIFQPLAKKAYENDSARTKQEQQNEALISNEMKRLEELARGKETTPTEREEILGKIADFNIKLCNKYSDRIRRDEKYFIANNVLGTVAAGLIGGKGAQMTTDWLAGPGMLNMFPQGAQAKIIPENSPKVGVIPEDPNPTPTEPGVIENPPPSTTNPGVIENPPPESTGPVISEDAMKAATIGKGEGIEHALRRQLEIDPEKFGFKGDITDKTAIREWSGSKAHLIAIDQNYVGANGTETRVLDLGPSGPEGNPAYVLDIDASGKPSIQEYFEGKPSGTGGTNSPYEYGYDKPASPRYTSALDNVSEQSSGNSGNDWNPPEQAGNGDVIEYGDNELTGPNSEYVDTSLSESVNPVNEIRPPANSDTYTPDEKDWIKKHDFIAENNYDNLPIEKLKEIESTYNANNNFLNEQVNKLPPSLGRKDLIIENINDTLNKGSADAFVDYDVEKVKPIFQPLHQYINKIHEVTELDPISKTPLSAGETPIDFIKRGLFKAAADGNLDKLKL